MPHSDPVVGALGNDLLSYCLIDHLCFDEIVLIFIVGMASKPLSVQDYHERNYC